MMIGYFYKRIASPVGSLKLMASEKGLSSVTWDDPDRIQSVPDTEDSHHPILLQAEKQLNEYFAKSRRSFSITLDFDGTEFNRRVWTEMLKIPYGETRTYGEIAKCVGGMEVVRAVGGALNKNPIAIIGPCHRVIGASGKLVGFGGGLANKAFLLRLEDEYKNPSLFSN
uniref:Methylated-DNA--protein-cysteine methyltransferase n=1 Tax=uncultured bacterium BLR19 TaxID=506519 RepID=C0INX7_9BACT|nr:methylated-DNA-protein-cysteine methyltransferase [uncultured bacterium BLR19]